MDSGQLLAPDVPRALIAAEDENLLDNAVHALAAGDPPIVVYRNANGIVVDLMTIQPGEEKLLAERLLQTLTIGWAPPSCDSYYIASAAGLETMTYSDASSSSGCFLASTSSCTWAIKPSGPIT